MAVPPLFIAGMHRSGTSACARLLQHAGVDVGGRLMPAQLDNTLGYYEDLDFVELNEALIAAGVGDRPELEPGWAHPDALDRAAMEPLKGRLAELVAERSARDVLWGFKDPRTTILLDLYDEAAPDACYLFVYREPWDVVASMLRTHRRPLRGRADLAVRAWTAYNDRVLAFCRAHPGRSALVHVDAIGDRPRELLELLATKADWLAALEAERAAPAFVPQLLRRSDAASPLEELLVADHPDALAAYTALEEIADLPGRRRVEADSGWRVAKHPGRARLDIEAVLVGPTAGGAEDAVVILRPELEGPPAALADAGVGEVGRDHAVVVFGSAPRPEALAAAAIAVRDRPQLGAVLLAAGEPHPLEVLDPLTRVDAGAALLVRRDAWLAARGFGELDPIPGFEAWALAVACHAGDLEVARIGGAVEGAQTLVAEAREDAKAARAAALERHPRLAAAVALAAERTAEEATRASARMAQQAAQAADEAGRALLTAVAAAEAAAARADHADARTASHDRLASTAADTAAAAIAEVNELTVALREMDAERHRVALQLEAMRGTRAWQLIVSGWRLRDRLLRR